ncbi:hypothetical protein G3M48_007960 [Beauveria asiatica]|uniref:Uncharacterized protein n=1 Tax=Beauveria asiatica TaxID=1069075 RepID=A0AAW0S4Q0_9HYPO
MCSGPMYTQSPCVTLLLHRELRGSANCYNLPPFFHRILSFPIRAYLAAFTSLILGYFVLVLYLTFTPRGPVPACSLSFLEQRLHTTLSHFSSSICKEDAGKPIAAFVATLFVVGNSQSRLHYQLFRVVTTSNKPSDISRLRPQAIDSIRPELINDHVSFPALGRPGPTGAHIAVSLNKPTRGKHATTFVIFDWISITNVSIAKLYIDACIRSFCIVHVNGLNNFNYSKYSSRPSDPSHKQHNICEFGISGATTSGRSSTSTSVASETSPASSPVPSSGITSGAAAGIGIGVAIVVVAVAVIAFCLLRNRKQQAAPRHSIEISKPLPGSGPTYPTRDDRERDRDSYDKYGHDIEMTSHRYEDMIPSQQPRNMV